MLFYTYPHLKDLYLMSFFYQPEGILLVLTVSFLLIIYINKNTLAIKFQNFRTHRCLKSIGLEQINNLPCSDGLEGEFNIDRLILLDQSILMIQFKKFPGRIFGSESIDEWTQVLGSKSYKFDNPLYQLSIQAQCLQKLIPSIPIEARIFFDFSAEFPKSIPTNIIHPSSIEKRFLSSNRHKVSDSISSGWKILLKLKKDTKP